MRALVTGHLGFVGRRVFAELSARGYNVHGIDSRHDPSQDVRRVMRDRLLPRFDLVVHCAAVVGGRQVIDGAPLETAVDLAIDAELFQWALETRPERVVYFSSSAAYPVDLQRGYSAPLKETDIDLDRVRTPDMVYGWAKLTGELLAKYARAQGLAVTVVRPFSGYGEDQDTSYPFPAIIDRALDRADPLPIWGVGVQRRDFIHVDDVVAATLVAATEGIDGPVNLGWGRATDFFELATLAARECGYDPEVVPQRDAPMGVFERVCDPTEMLKFYTPKVTLEEGVARAVKARRC